MAGVSDSPCRRLARRHGSALSWTEFVSADYLVAGDPEARKHFQFVREERPILFQIFGADPRRLLRALQIAEEFEPDGIDLNMGCSVAAVAGKGAGAGMLRNVARTAAIFERLARRSQRPLSAKIRLGWDESTLVHVELARALEQSGAAMITVHGRTKAQGYSGRANWQRIAELKDAVSIPVLGSGDVQSLAEAELRIRESGVDGVLIGRAAIGNPWIFAGPGRPDEAQILAVCLQHWRWAREAHGKGALRPFRKHLARYLSHSAHLQRWRLALLQEEQPDSLERILLDLLQRFASADRRGTHDLA
ncbi:MAG: tRNA-dihydrouridine synthase family protein [Leptospirales bacterium]|nr:tRNA-dihydrouridine synthase family protein [Leptospirales bacterium]